MRLGVAARSSRTTAKEQLEGAAERGISLCLKRLVSSQNYCRRWPEYRVQTPTFGVPDAPEAKNDDGSARAVAGFVRRS